MLPELFANRYPGQFDDAAEFVRHLPDSRRLVRSFARSRRAAPLVYPSAIGSEVADLAFDSRPAGGLAMRAHAIANRVGPEVRVRFYGSRFVVDPGGRVLRRASQRPPELAVVDLDFAEIARANAFFGFFDTRRPETYRALVAPCAASRLRSERTVSVSRRGRRTKTSRRALARRRNPRRDPLWRGTYAEGMSRLSEGADNRAVRK